jgi:hypothetical protein
MGDFPLAQRRLLMQWFLAADCFAAALKQLDHILAQPADIGPHLYMNSMAAFFVVYARPFGNNRGVGRLRTEIVPDAYTACHDEILLYRDKVFAHSDLDGRIEEVNEYLGHAELVTWDGRYRWDMRLLLPRQPRLTEYRSLVLAVQRASESRFTQINAEYGSSLALPKGRYRLNVRNDTDPCFRQVSDDPS